MIREIVLVDFMSHRHTIIEPAAGLTVLVGPNNSGKSAVTTALQVVAANVHKEHVIRHGCKECSITVETDSGHTVTWRRKGKTVSYTIDGEDIHRLQGDVPDELHKVLRLAPVASAEKGAGSFSVHFAPQKEPIFLLNGSGKQAATFFASASDASRLMAMQQRHKEKTREHASAEKRLLVEVESLKARLEDLAPVSVLEQTTADAFAEHKRIMDQAALLERLAMQIRSIAEATRALTHTHDIYNSFAILSSPPALIDTNTIDAAIRQITVSDARIGALENECWSLSDLVSPPALAETRHIMALCGDIAALLATEDQAHDHIEALRELTSPPVLGDDATMDRLCRDMVRGLKMLAAGKAEITALRSLEHPPELTDEKAIITAINQLEMGAQFYGEQAAEALALGNLTHPPTPMDGEALREAILRYEAATGVVSDSQHEFEEVQKVADETKSQITQWAATNPTCPICGADIGDDNALLGAHRHG